ncbi:MAG: phage holin family protein [Leadbetterella sp.]
MSFLSGVSDFLKLDELKANFIRLIEAKFELKKLEIKDQLKEPIAKLVYTLVAVLLAVVLYVFFGIGMSLFLNNLLDSVWLGFLIWTGIQAFLFFMFILQKHSITNRIKTRIEPHIDAIGNSTKSDEA